MTNEQFMNTLKSWREKYPEGPARTAAYLSAVPKQVRDSFAFEGDHIDIKLLEDNLDLTPSPGIQSSDHIAAD